MKSGRSVTREILNAPYLSRTLGETSYNLDKLLYIGKHFADNGPLVIRQVFSPKTHAVIPPRIIKFK